MEIVNPPFIDTSSSSRRYYSDDVNRPTRFYGMFFDLKRTEASMASIQLFVITNDIARDNALPPGGDYDFTSTIFRVRFQGSFEASPTTQRQNPFTLILPAPVYSPNGITLLFSGGESDHILDRSINIFVER